MDRNNICVDLRMLQELNMSVKINCQDRLKPIRMKKYFEDKDVCEQFGQFLLFFTKWIESFLRNDSKILSVNDTHQPCRPFRELHRSREVLEVQDRPAINIHNF